MAFLPVAVRHATAEPFGHATSALERSVNQCCVIWSCHVDLIMLHISEE